MPARENKRRLAKHFTARMQSFLAFTAESDMAAHSWVVMAHTTRAASCWRQCGHCLRTGENRENQDGVGTEAGAERKTAETRTA